MLPLPCLDSSKRAWTALFGSPRPAVRPFFLGSLDMFFQLQVCWVVLGKHTRMTGPRALRALPAAAVAAALRRAERAFVVVCRTAQMSNTLAPYIWCPQRIEEGSIGGTQPGGSLAPSTQQQAPARQLRQGAVR